MKTQMKGPAELRKEAQMLRLWTMLMAAGCSLLDAIRITAETFYGFKTLLLDIHRRVAKGATVQQAFDQTHIKAFSTYSWLLLGCNGSGTEIGESLRCATLMLDRIIVMAEAGVPEEQIRRINCTRFLGFLVRQGMPILEALRWAGREYLSTDEVTKLMEPLKKGDSIVEGFRANAPYFDDADFLLLDIGEQMGSFPEMCEQISELRERAALCNIKHGTACGIPTDAVLRNIAEVILLRDLTDSTSSPHRGFRVAYRCQSDPVAKQAYATVLQSLEDGSNPSIALMSLPDLFPPYALEMVRVGEQNGNLEDTFKILVDYLKWEHLGVEPASIRQLEKA